MTASMFGHKCLFKEYLVENICIFKETKVAWKKKLMRKEKRNKDVNKIKYFLKNK